MTEQDGQTGGRADGQEELPESIRVLARDINNPPATPREEIWARVQAARADRRLGGSAEKGVIPLQPRRADRPTVRRFTVWAAGIAEWSLGST